MVPPRASDLEATGVLSWAVSQLVADVLPFRILSGSAEVIVARTIAGWRITLINNLGVTKECTYSSQWPHGGCTPDQIDATKRQNVALHWDTAHYGRPHSVRELITNTKLLVRGSGDKLVVEVPAGEVRVLSVDIQPTK